MADTKVAPKVEKQEAATPENTPEVAPRIVADIRQVLLNKALADAAAKAEADFNDKFDPTAKDMPATVEEALAVSKDPLPLAQLRDLPGYQAATPSAQENFEDTLMRVGTLVKATEDVYDASDLSEKTTIYAGDKIKGVAVGYVSAHYIVEARRQRILAGK